MRDPEFQDPVVGETRTLLSTIPISAGLSDNSACEPRILRLSHEWRWAETNFEVRIEVESLPS
jgi:hypothetical protein